MTRRAIALGRVLGAVLALGALAAVQGCVPTPPPVVVQLPPFVWDGM